MAADVDRQLMLVADPLEPDSLRCHRHQGRHGLSSHEDGLVVLVCQENPDHVRACWFRAMAEAGLDQVATEVAVHAVVGPSWNVAGVAGGIDLHVEVATLIILTALAATRLLEQNDAIRRRMIDLLGQARERGQLIEGVDFDHLVLAARALVYGLARMAIDGHFPRWHPTEPPPQVMRHALGLFIRQITAPPAT